MTISVFNSLIFLIAFLQEKIFNGFKILNDELLFDALFLYCDLPGKKILGYNFLKFKMFFEPKNFFFFNKLQKILIICSDMIFYL